MACQCRYYNDYPGAVRKLANSKFRWVSAPSGNPSFPTVEFVTSPNNPDGEVRVPRSSASMAVYDRAYWWPHFGPVSSADDELMIFTLSKLTGHAGTRIGWALVKNQTVASKMARYIHARGRVSHDGMLRASKLLQHMITTAGAPLHWAQAKMDSRWATLTGMLCANTACTVPRNPDFVLREPGVKTPRICAFTHTSRVPALPYMWLECTAPSDLAIEGGCAEVMRRAGIDLVAGKSYGAPAGRFIRLELLMAQDTFDIVAQRLQALVSR
jgi:L-tryptophan--pyruvate aminotransferase